MKKPNLFDVYTFAQLEIFLNDQEYNQYTFFRVWNMDQECYALMTTFKENFVTATWLSGDGVLFYQDGEVHSSNPDDEFRLIAIISIAV